MTCTHENRTVYDSRSRILAGTHSQWRRSKCLKCGHKWTSYELNDEQLDSLLREAQGNIADKIQECLNVARHVGVRSLHNGSSKPSDADDELGLDKASHGE